MLNLFEKNKIKLEIAVLLLLGFVVRFYFIDKISVGDLMNYVEWGQRLYDKGPKNFYFSSNWYYSVPVYPPVSMWMFAGLHYLYEHRYVLAQMHNIVKFPPSSFVIYFYKYGEIVLLKFTSIFCDLVLSLVIFKLIYKLTKNNLKSILGFCFFLFNPIPIFISGYWGQTDSIVALLGMLSFYLLINRNIILSAPLLFLSIYFKPSWAILIPFYVYIMFVIKLKASQILISSLLVITLFILTTLPFANDSVFMYGWKIYKLRYPIPIGFDGKASISAFNFQTIFWKIDIDLGSSKLLGIKSSTVGSLLFFAANLISFLNFNKQKNKLFGMLSGLFIIGMSSFLFMQTMLERYFFPAFVPIIILAFSKPKILLNMLLVNLILLVNIYYSFYRRGNDYLYHMFIDNNYLLMRMVSFVQVTLFITLVTPLMLQFKRGHD